jgi:2-keto-4-pentenoate hydratase/2-oxohepta-3-ene-1,7-dioic acid hydratase in catechol pathway
MRVGTFTSDPDGRYRPGIFLDDERILDVEAAAAALAIAPPPERELAPGRWWVTAAGLDHCRALLEAAGRLDGEHAAVVARADARLGPPVTGPRKMLAVGRNYSSHLAEGQKVWADRGRVVERPPFPIGFAKFASALVGDGEAIELPPGEPGIDYEIELAVVIGRRTHRVSADEALGHVAGYCVANDVSARVRQLEEVEQLGILLSKNFPTFAPLGPWMVTADELPSPDRLEMELTVNGEVRQRARTDQMLFSVPEVVAAWSVIGLDPGDVILTGTPGGVALSLPDPAASYLRDGDWVEAYIERVGRLRNPVRQEAAGAA